MTRSLKPQPAWHSGSGKATAAKPAPLVCTEPREGTWTGSPEWGNRYEGVYPSAADESIEVLRNDRIVGPPRLVGVMLSRSLSTAVNADVFARVTVGAGNASRSFLCDFRGRLAVIANSIRVEALAYAPEPFGVHGKPYNRHALADSLALARLRCSALLGIDGAAPSSPPTFTPPYLRVSDNAYLQLPPPEHATRVRPIVSYDRVSGMGNEIEGGAGPISGAWQQSIDLHDFEIVLWTLYSGVSVHPDALALATYELSDEIITRGVELPPDCKIVTLHNYSGSSAILGASFELGV